jgi:uncharacterized membrane protein YgcG
MVLIVTESMITKKETLPYEKTAFVIEEDPTITLDKTAYDAGEPITVAVTGITQEMRDAKAFVATYNADAPLSAWRNYKYPNAGSDTLTFNAPFDNGDYEMRLFSFDDDGSEASFIMKVAFTVTGGNDPIGMEDGGSGGGSGGGGGGGGYWDGAYEWWYPEWTPAAIAGWKEGDPYPDWWYPGWVPPGYYD